MTPAQAAALLGKVTARRAVVEDIADTSVAKTSVTCEAGETLVGGGGGFVKADTGQYDRPGPGAGLPTGANGLPVVDGAEPRGWVTSGKNETGFARDFVAVALCATTGL